MASPSTPRPQNHGRTKSGFSFGSHKSSNSVPKIDLTESPKDKISSTMHTKADPNKAMTELQPSSVALEKSTIISLRSIQHRDGEGNVIADPDRSNPTRPRFERPLDTIRSFEAAINGTTERRTSARPVSTYGSTYGSVYGQNQKPSRRSVYNPDYSNGTPPQPRYGAEDRGYHGSQASSRPSSYHDAYQQGNYGRRTTPRTVSDPMLYGNGHNVSSSGNNNGQYGVQQGYGGGQNKIPYGNVNSQNLNYPGQGYANGHGHQQSYDATTASTANSNGTEQWANSTNPSSENSSNDRIHQIQKPEPTDNYGFAGFGGGIPTTSGPILEEHGAGSPVYGQPGYGKSYSSPRAGPAFQGNSVPLPTPPHSPPQVYQPPYGRSPRPGNTMRSNSGNTYDNVAGNRTSTSEKRKSWIKRAFSRG